MEDKLYIYSINGPVITVKGAYMLKMQETVLVGKEGLRGEVLNIENGTAVIQVYEPTEGLLPGEEVKRLGIPMSVTLGPGLLKGIYDGIERPLEVIAGKSGAFIKRGIVAEPLDSEKKWSVRLSVSVGDRVEYGDIFAECPETERIIHRSMVPEGAGGEVVFAAPDGEYTVEDVIAKTVDSRGETHELKLKQVWPIRDARRFNERMPVDRPLVTGQRIIDSFFPLAKGGAAAIPGGFGTGKTMTQHQLAKWCDADIIVYIGCGERGNEMTQVLNEFGELIDPLSGRPLMERTVLIANTSNMPVAAREASIYTGITIAEYYRDMGYHVAVMADSTSRWAEALREISGRLEEMPAEEGFPAYLPSRISEFYERAGYVKTLCGREGSVTIIGAVSPQGSDFSEPVTQNTRRFIRCFWALDKSLAYQRHYPAINWNTSYSEYLEELEIWYSDNVSSDFLRMRGELIRILSEEDRLMEIVRLIGSDVLPDSQKLVLEISRIVRQAILQQNAYDKTDTYVTMDKQYRMMKAVCHLYSGCKEAMDKGARLQDIVKSGVFSRLNAMKFEIKNEEPEKFELLENEIDMTLKGLTAGIAL